MKYAIKTLTEKKVELENIPTCDPVSSQKIRDCLIDIDDALYYLYKRVATITDVEEITELKSKLLAKNNKIISLKKKVEHNKKKRTFWNEEQEKFLDENYLKLDVMTLSRILGRTENSVKTKIYLSGRRFKTKHR